MQHGSLDLFPCQQISSFERAPGHEPRADKGHVLTVVKQPGLADLEAVTRRIKHDRDLAAQQAHVDWPLICRDGRDDLSNLGGVAGIDDDKVGNGPHQGQVLDALVRAAVAGGQPGQTGNDLYVCLAQGRANGDEVIGAARGENAIGGREGRESRARQTRSHAD